MGRSSKRDILLDTAEALFSARGFGATGINRITSEAGVVPMTLYNNFPDKEALVLATLTRRSEALLATVQDGIKAAGDEPRDRILAVFGAVDKWVEGELETPVGFAGCLFLKAANEYPEPRDPARQIAVEHKRAFVAMFRRETMRMDVADPDDLALSLHLLIDGAIAQAQMFADAGSLRRGQNMAGMMLDRTTS